jgi:pSer/pThr/pTyr-binding forkhead associated (FHA) protein
MKLSLVVLNPGRMEGKSIPITLSQFVIGRDPQCHLRPTSPLISKRHCAVLVKGTRVFIRDFGSTNGTLVNDQPVDGESELHDHDRLKIGPLEFRLLYDPSPTAKPTPVPATGSSKDSPDDEAVAAMLLSVGDDPIASPSGSKVDSDGVPAGSTVMEMRSPETATPLPGSEKAPVDKAEAAKQAAGNTSSAAKAILEKYMRRPRH